MDKEDIRNLFYGLHNKTHLAACSRSPLLKDVKTSMDQYFDDVQELGNPWELWTQKVNEARSLFARLINASEKEIAVLYSVSSCLNAVMSALDFDRKKSVVTTDLEFPTTNFALLGYERYGAKIVTIKNVNGSIDPEDYEQYIDESTVLTTVTHVSSLNGFTQNIGEVGKKAHEKGSLLYVDDYQSLGSNPVDVKKEEIDFLASGNLKWLLGVSGIAFLYVNERISDHLEPSDIGWFSQKDPFKFGAEKLDYAPGARRFENGTWSIPSTYASIEGMKTVIRNKSYIESENRKLFRLALESARGKGFPVSTPDKSSNILALSVKEPHMVEKRLREKYSIITSARGDSIRVSPHFYNTEEEIEDAMAIIGEQLTKQ